MSSRSPRGVANLADLAKLAGVSSATVSRALAGNPVISAATRKRVTDLAAEHGFKLNQQARNLRLRRTQAIGVVVPLGHETGQHFSDPFFITMLGHLADALTERGFDLLLSRVIPTDDAWLDRMLDAGRTDGLIVIGQSNQSAALDRAAARGAAMVVWGGRRPGQIHCSVGTDNEAGAVLATRHLLDCGRRHLAFFGNPEVPEIADRQNGFLIECRKAEVQADTLPVHLTPESAYAMIADYLERHPIPTGIVAASDTIAMMAVRALAERRLRVPEDVAVIGYDDVTLASHTSPPLTTIRQDIARGTALLVELLFRKMAGEAVESIILPPELIVRQSTVG